MEIAWRFAAQPISAQRVGEDQEAAIKVIVNFFHQIASLILSLSASTASHAKVLARSRARRTLIDQILPWWYFSAVCAFTPWAKNAE
jgi:hypothetical protein